MRWLTRVLYFLVMVGFLAGCSGGTEQEVAVGDRRSPDEVFTDFVTEQSDSGLVEWKLTAPRANRFGDEKIVILEKPTIEFFDDLGNTKTTLVSDTGEYSEETRDMLARGNVVVRSVDGDVLETDSLLWANTRDRISTEAFVKLTRGGDVLTGYGLECDPNLSHVDIKRDVRATIADEEGGVK